MLKEFWDSLISTLPKDILQALFSFVVAIAVLLIGLRLIKWLIAHLKKTKLSARIDPTVHTFILSVISIGLKLLLVIAAASIMGVSNASIVAVLGSAGLAIGLALQGSLANFAGGVMILLFRPFLVGDFIELKSGESGTVTSISIFYTTLHTIDNHKLVIPNGTVSNASVSNYSAMQERRLSLDFSVRPRLHMIRCCRIPRLLRV